MDRISDDFGASRRRDFLRGASIVALALAIWPKRKGWAQGDGGKVTIVPFSDDGTALPATVVDKVTMSDAAWKAKLSPASYHVTRHDGTEAPFTGDLLNEHRKGIFRCIDCDTALYSSTAKFESGTGWPSFWEPIAKENVAIHSDHSFGMVRDAVSCPRCDAHLGHVFDDGPKPTGLRFCMNSVALRFVPAPVA
jgi:peptide-methionine (R)-S-oxide reductase